MGVRIRHGHLASEIKTQELHFHRQGLEVSVISFKGSLLSS